MKQINEHLYYADEGKVIVRISDNFVMGDGIDLGDNDSIDNYTEINSEEV